jgi:hypothetical protein
VATSVLHVVERRGGRMTYSMLLTMVYEDQRHQIGRGMAAAAVPYVTCNMHHPAYSHGPNAIVVYHQLMMGNPEPLMIERVHEALAVENNLRLEELASEFEDLGSEMVL